MINIIIDCDPGHDDAIELMLATRADNMNLLGVTTVAGNTLVDYTAKNALKILNIAEASGIPVYKGCEKPLSRPLFNSAGKDIHGADGLGGVELPEPKTQLGDIHAVDFIIKVLREADLPITVVGTGPLTNIAAALIVAPDIASKIEKFVLMGGVVRSAGNIFSCSEFNMYVDPEAADIVFKSGVPIWLNTLDVTMKAVFYKEDIERFNTNSIISQTVYKLLKHYSHQYKEHFGAEACPIHDALCIASLIDESLVKYGKTYCEISVRNDMTRGETVCDLWGRTGNEPNIHLSESVDRLKFVDLLVEYMQKPRI